MGKAHQDEVDGSEEDGEPGEESVVVGVLKERVEGERGEGGVGEREENLCDCAVALGRGFALECGAEEGEEEESDEENCGGELVGGVELHVPADEVDDGGGEGSEEEAWPRLETDESDGGEVDGEDVGEEEDLVVAAGGEKQRCGEASGEGVGGEELAVLGPGHVGVPRGDEDHGHEGYAGGQEMVELEGSPEGEIKDSASDGFERVREGVEAVAAEALRPEDDGCARDEAGEDAAEGADPVVVHGELEEPGCADEKGDDADAAEELGADAIFERGRPGGGARGGVWSGERWRRGFGL